MVLDVACGAWDVAREYAKLINHVNGMDLTPFPIEREKDVQN
jgi:ubiquinone/menaquinone biosynthesis C-methylase UbiE